jgi:methanogenic corrinoid protein MtbC1
VAVAADTPTPLGNESEPGTGGGDVDKVVEYLDNPVSRRPPRAPSHLREFALRRMVERHVIPRLALRAPAIVRPERFGDGLSEEVRGLTRLALDADGPRSRQVLHRLYEAGASFSQLQIGLLAPAAKRLDLLWRNDEVSFIDVTLAAGSLQQMMRFVALDLAVTGHQPPLPRSILIASAPGEAHGLGAAMAAEFFRRDGWSVVYDPHPTAEGLVARVAGGWTDVLGLSVVCRPDAAALRLTIARARAASVNPDLMVIAGGEAMAQDPRLLGAIGADATLAALPAAPARAHRLVSALFGARAAAARAAG